MPRATRLAYWFRKPSSSATTRNSAACVNWCWAVASARSRAHKDGAATALEDSGNFRNKPEMGGGGLLGSGVYPMVTARYIFANEPTRVFAAVRRDAETGVDCLVSTILYFPARQAGFTCPTELAVQQHMVIFGNHGRIELSDPFAQASDRKAQILIGGDRGIWDDTVEKYETF